MSQARIDALSPAESRGFWPLCPDVAIEVKSATDDFSDTVLRVKFYRKHGSGYAAAIDPATRYVVELGTAPSGLTLNFETIIDG